MFKHVPNRVLDRMKWLKDLDSNQLEVKAPPPGRIWAIHEDAASMLALLALCAPEGHVVEIGSGGGYSGLWLSLAMSERAKRYTDPAYHVLNTFEIDQDRAILSLETYESAGVIEFVKLTIGDARDHIANIQSIAFAFIDADKTGYSEYFTLLKPQMVAGGIIVADNAISHKDELRDFFRLIDNSSKFDSLIIDVGQGLLITRKRF